MTGEGDELPPASSFSESIYTFCVVNENYYSNFLSMFCDSYFVINFHTVSMHSVSILQ